MTDVIRAENDELKEAELTPEEWAQEVSRQTESLLGMDTETFTVALGTGKVDRGDWRVEYVADLLE